MNQNDLINLTIEALKSPDSYIRQAAVEAFENREVPLEWIEKALQDEDWGVRQAAVEALFNKLSIKGVH